MQNYVRRMLSEKLEVSVQKLQLLAQENAAYNEEVT